MNSSENEICVSQKRHTKEMEYICECCLKKFFRCCEKRKNGMCTKCFETFKENDSLYWI